MLPSTHLSSSLIICFLSTPATFMSYTPSLCMLPSPIFSLFTLSQSSFTSPPFLIPLTVFLLMTPFITLALTLHTSHFSYQPSPPSIPPTPPHILAVFLHHLFLHHHNHTPCQTVTSYISLLLLWFLSFTHAALSIICHNVWH